MIVRLATMPSFGDLDPNAVLAPSRDELSNETDLLLQRIAQLGQDWFNSDDNVVSQDLLTRWDTFVSQVKAWDSGPRFLTHIVNFTWRDELLAYQNQFNSLRAEFGAGGVPLTTPPFTFTPPAPSTLDKALNAAGNAAKNATKPLTDAFTTLEYVGIGLGVAAVGFIFYLTYETGKTARAIGPSVLRR